MANPTPRYGAINNAPEVEESQDKSTCNCQRVINSIFYLCCFLSGQYHMSSTGNNNGSRVELAETSRHKLKKIWSILVAVIQAIMCTGLVVVNVAHVTLNFIVEACQIMNITHSPRVFENKEVNCTLPQYWKINAAILVSTIAELYSYIMMTIVLYLIYGYFRKYCYKLIANCSPCCCASMKKALVKQNISFSPFYDSCTCRQNSSTALTPEQPNACFFLHYLFCMSIFFCACTIVTIVYESEMYQKHPCQINGINLASYILFLICQFCSIQSVFIFSKIVYIITGQLKKLIEVMDKVNVEKNNLLERIEAPNELCSYLEIEDINLRGMLNSADEREVNKGLYYLLRNIDQKFIEQTKPILKLFGIWFIYHWFFNALTTVLLSAIIIEFEIDVIAYKWKNAEKVIPTDSEDVFFELVYIVYLILLVSGHTYLFVYPCFRAASITATREKLILDVSRRQWRHIPHSVETSFIQYLKTQNFSFKVPALCCAEFSFNSTMALVSLFIGILGIFLNIHFF